MNKICFFSIVMICLICSVIIVAYASTTTTSTTTTTSYTTIDTTSTIQTTTPPSPINVEIIDGFQNGLRHSVPTLPGTQRALVFIAFCESTVPAALNSVTYGGRPMTRIIQRSAGTTAQNYVAAFILNDANIAAATNDTFVVSWSATPAEVTYSHVFLKNVRQSSPTGATASNATTTGNPNPLTATGLTAVSGDLVIAAADNGTRGTCTWNNYFTRRVHTQLPSSTASAATIQGAGINYTASVTFSGAFSRESLIGFVVRLTN